MGTRPALPLSTCGAVRFPTALDTTPDARTALVTALAVPLPTIVKGATVLMGSFIRFVNIVVVSVMEMVVKIVGDGSRFEDGGLVVEGVGDVVGVGVEDIVVRIVEV